MISGEERREVAENLSDAAQAWRDTFPDEACDLGDVSALMQDLCHFAGLRGKVLCGDIFQRFAGLIDRETCRNLATKPADELLCSECGEHVDIAYLDSADDYHARYCPNCGAEVVE